MSVQTEIDRIISAVEAAHNKILEKGGTTERPYTVAGLEQAIGTIPNAVVQPLEVTENGTYTTPDGVDGYSPVTVNVAASGGRTVETCTVTINCFNDIMALVYTVFEDGIITSKFLNNSSTSFLLENVICGSAITVCNNYEWNGFTFENGASFLGTKTFNMWAIKAPTVADSNSTITVYDAD